MESKPLRNKSLEQSEINRYARHISLPEIGIKGQTLLKNSSVLCIGSGGLGSPLLLYLAASGIGNLGIVDFDVVEDSNLQRQVIHSTAYVNQPKTYSAKKRILGINPSCKVDIFETILTENNAINIIKKFDIICDCSDNFPTRYLINDACVILGKPIIYGSISGFEGQITVFNLTNKSPNYRDLIPSPPPSGAIPSCSEGGVMGVLPGIIGVIQATEAIKVITGIGEILDGRLLTFNALKMTFKELKLKDSGEKKLIKKLIDYKKFCLGLKYPERKVNDLEIESIDIKELEKVIICSHKDIRLIDVREQKEFDIESIEGAELIPIDNIENGEAINKIKGLSSLYTLYVYCQTGKRSLKAVGKLKDFGIKAINVNGGINEWKKRNLN